jgi:hypothetical protein
VVLGALLELDPAQIDRIREDLGAGKGYQRFEIPKLGGRAPRVISAPVEPLKRLQRALIALLDPLPLPVAVHGFRRHHSIVTNAERHLGARALLNVDLKDFFHSVDRPRVERVLRRSLLPRLIEETGEVSASEGAPLVELIAELTTHPVEGWPAPVLPQGAPTSPFLANLAARKLDREIIELLAEIPGEWSYTRYADDLAISAPHEIDRRMIGLVLERIQRSGFSHHPHKVQLASTLKGSPFYRQRLEITGLILDTREKVLRIPRARMEQFRTQLHQAALLPELDLATRQQIDGFVAFVFMVYRGLPPALGNAYRRYTEAHRLTPLEAGKSRRIARRRAAQKELYR